MNKGVQNLTNKPRQTGNVTVNELLISSLAQTDALAKLLIEKGLITREEFMQKISEERATYQKLLIRLSNESQSYCTEAAEHLGINHAAQT
jgi:type IV secretory pathway component VirB8